jgi:hypothetical protein
MINEKVTNSGKTVLDILQEFYDSNRKDLKFIDDLIEAFNLMGGPQSAFLADNAQLINSLVGARQKTTRDLLDMLNTVQKLQANESKDGPGFDKLKDLIDNEPDDLDEDERDNVIDLVKDIRKRAEESRATS